MKLVSFFTFVFAVSGPALAAPTYETYAKLYRRLATGATVAQLEDVLPGLAENMKTAGEVSSHYWTDSTPYDELAKAYILPDRVLDGLGIRHQVTGGVVHVPAGLMHTYGYLFSQLPTAFGLKGKRWIESRIDERLGLPAGTFSPLPPGGEFTSNLTVVLFQLIGERVPKLARAARLKPKAGVEGYVEQRVTWKTPEGKTEKALVFTDLVKLGPLAGFETADVDLLIYDVMSHGEHRLVTAFPIERKFAETIMKTLPSSSGAFSPRFNLYVNPLWKVIAQENSGFKRGYNK